MHCDDVLAGRELGWPRILASNVDTIVAKYDFLYIIWFVSDENLWKHPCPRRTLPKYAPWDKNVLKKIAQKRLYTMTGRSTAIIRMTFAYGVAAVQYVGNTKFKTIYEVENHYYRLKLKGFTYVHLSCTRAYTHTYYTRTHKQW